MSTNTTSQTQTSSTDTEPDAEVPSSEENGAKASADNVDSNASGSSEPVSGTEAFNISAQTQMQFGDGGDLQPKDETVEVTLGDFDVDLDKAEKETRIDRPEASGLMADDRPELDTRDSGEQASLFGDADETQQTLAGESAQDRCLFSTTDQGAE